MSLLVSPLAEMIVTQPFGPSDISYPGYDGHMGIDLRALIGTKVYAAHDGYVFTANDPDGYGSYILLTGDEWVTLYAHLSKFEAAHGSRVQAGDLIALSGHSGRTTGAHLHIGLRPRKDPDFLNGYKGWIDPAPYLFEEEETDLVAVRWHAEEAVREVEQAIDSLESARRRLLDHVVGPLVERRSTSNMTIGWHLGNDLAITDIDWEILGAPSPRRSPSSPGNALAARRGRGCWRSTPSCTLSPVPTTTPQSPPTSASPSTSTSASAPWTSGPGHQGCT